MAQNPSEKVRSSNQLWGDQVGIINAIEAMDTDPERAVGPFSQNYTPGGSPVIYIFGGRRRFVRAADPYQ